MFKIQISKEVEKKREEEKNKEKLTQQEQYKLKEDKKHSKLELRKIACYRAWRTKRILELTTA